MWTSRVDQMPKDAREGFGHAREGDVLSPSTLNLLKANGLFEKMVAQSFLEQGDPEAPAEDARTKQIMRRDPGTFNSIFVDTFDQVRGSFQLKTSVGTSSIRIPKQVVLTGPGSSFNALLRRRKTADLFNWLGLSKDMTVRYFNDSACENYIRQNYDQELVGFFDHEQRGSYRGDLCRTAILSKEGGFYVDLDMQLRVPLLSLVDDETTFMTARSQSKGILNAIFGAAPGSSVLLATLDHMRRWYRNETVPEVPMGPVTMQRGLEEVAKRSCPERNWRTDSVFQCGEEPGIRLYSEVFMTRCAKWGSLLCPRQRWKFPWEGTKYGLFAGTIAEIAHSDRSQREQNFIGWVRAEDCRKLGCKMSGGSRY